MQFRSELLQEPKHRKGSEGLARIYDVYRTPDGHVEGEDTGLARALEHIDSILRQSEAAE